MVEIRGSLAVLAVLAAPRVRRDPVVRAARARSERARRAERRFAARMALAGMPRWLAR